MAGESISRREFFPGPGNRRLAKPARPENLPAEPTRLAAKTRPSQPANLFPVASPRFLPAPTSNPTARAPDDPAQAVLRVRAVHRWPITATLAVNRERAALRPAPAGCAKRTGCQAPVAGRRRRLVERRSWETVAQSFLGFARPAIDSAVATLGHNARYQEFEVAASTPFPAGRACRRATTNRPQPRRPARWTETDRARRTRLAFEVSRGSLSNS
jgi:hypothetical protein